ncbi:hypothetical protein MNBD_GAMMA03-204, partial [hydrothermal vent metagenome]
GDASWAGAVWIEITPDSRSLGVKADGQYSHDDRETEKEAGRRQEIG